MIVFLRDSEAQKPKHQKKIDKISLCATDYNLGQNWIKSTVTHNPQFLAEDCIKKNKDLQLIIVVGLDVSFFQVAEALYKTKAHCAIGYVPIDPKSFIAKKLKIHSIEEACKIISKKRVHEWNVSTVNEQVCFFSCETPVKKSPLSLPVKTKTGREIKVQYHDSFYILSKVTKIQIEINKNSDKQPFFTLHHKAKKMDEKSKTTFFAKFAALSAIKGREKLIVDGRKKIEAEKIVFETRPYRLFIVA